MPDSPGHKPWTTRCSGSPRHTHDYEQDGPAPRQCTCGHRRWLIKLGGSLPPAVECAKCQRPNRMATAYEIGRTRGPRGAVSVPSTPPF